MKCLLVVDSKELKMMKQHEHQHGIQCRMLRDYHMKKFLHYNQLQGIIALEGDLCVKFFMKSPTRNE